MFTGEVTRRPKIVSVRTAILGILAFFVFGLIGTARYCRGMAGSYDMGIFSQSGKAWSHGGPPSSPIRGLPNLFADHFSPITSLFGAAWAIWSDPRALIWCQATTLGIAVAICGLYFKKLPWWLGTLIGLLIILQKGFISAAFFDVHETGLGVPIMAALCWAVVRGNAPLTLASAFLLLLVKEDLGPTVAAFGLVWWLMHRTRRTAYTLVAMGVIGLIVSMGVIYLVNNHSQNVYVSSLTSSHPNTTLLASLPHRLGPTILFILSAGIIGIRSPICVAAIPTLAWRFISSNDRYWQTYYHYDVIILPIALCGLAYTLRRSSFGNNGALQFPPIPLAVALTALTLSAWQGVEKSANVPWWRPSAYTMSPNMTSGVVLLKAHQSEISGPIAAEQPLGPVLVSRHEVVMLTQDRDVHAEAAIMTLTGSSQGASQAAKKAFLEEQRRQGHKVYQSGDVCLIVLPGIQRIRL